MINLKETFEIYREAHFLKFSEATTDVRKVSNRPDVCALLLLDKLVPIQKNLIRDMIFAAEHDAIYLSVDPADLANSASEVDIKFLVQCGVMYSEPHDSLMMYV